MPKKKITKKKQPNILKGLRIEVLADDKKDKQEFQYGRIESRIRFHNLEAGSWPAFWLLENRIAQQPSKGDNDFSHWPSAGAGEIDVWEWFSNQPSSYITNFFSVVIS